MPVLLADTPAPTFESIKPMSFRKLFEVSPLGCVGMLLTGGIYAAMFGMAAVYGAMSGLSVGQIAAFVAALYVGGLAFQYPLGWLSDRMDRRALVMWLSAVGAGVMVLATIFALPFQAELAVALLLGGTINPLYSLLIAHTNDFLTKEDMASASAGLIFLNGFGAIFGPLVAGWLMTRVGPGGYFLIMAVLFGALAIYAGYRATRRAAPEAGIYAGVTPSASPLAVGAMLGQEGRS